MVAWTIYANSEEIDEIEVNVKGVIPVNEKKCVCRALKTAGTDISVVDNRGHGRVEKAIIQPYKSRVRNRKTPEIPDFYFDLGRLTDECYYLILAACSLGLGDEYVVIDGVKYLIRKMGNRFLHNEGLYVWCIIQRVEKGFHDYYDDLDDSET